MKPQKLTAQIQDYITSSNGMSSYLLGLEKGREATPHSWLYEKEDAERTLERWLSILDEANLRKSPLGSVFNQFDRAQLSKFGPQGKIPPIDSQECADALDPLFSPSEFDDEMALRRYFGDAKEFAKVLCGGRIKRLRPLSLRVVVDDMRQRDTLTTNSGFPNFTRRSLVQADEIRNAETGLAYDFPAIVLFRYYYGKLRPVWMYPMSMNLIESSYGQVIQDALLDSPLQEAREYVTPWRGYDDVKAVITSQAFLPGTTTLGGDTSKMDAHMRPAQLRLIYEIVKWLFQERYWDELYRCLMRVTTIPLLVSIDAMLTGPHGLASGSAWTQLSETVLTMFMAWRFNNASLTGQGIGDDFYWISRDEVSAERLVGYLSEYGLPANQDKQSISSDQLPFLQRLNHVGFFSRDNHEVLGGYYPTVRALESSLWPEKFHRPEDWNSDMFCIRQFMILENCVDDPCFDEFLRFVVNGHRDLIPFAKQSASKLARIQRQARLIPGLNPSYNQEKREKPLSSFTSIQLVSRM